MQVKLLDHTRLDVADTAISKCWDKSVPEDKVCERMDRVANKNKHASTIEHLVYNFDIDGISRACLQEVARHRIASYSVKSTRYTLKELKDLDYHTPLSACDKMWSVFSKYCVMTGVPAVDRASAKALKELKLLLQDGVPNDKAKYCLPEAYKTSLVMSINARSLQNFLELRSSKSALWEIQDLAADMYDALPEDHKFLFSKFVNGLIKV